MGDSTQQCSGLIPTLHLGGGGRPSEYPMQYHWLNPGWQGKCPPTIVLLQPENVDLKVSTLVRMVWPAVAKQAQSSPPFQYSFTGLRSPLAHHPHRTELNSSPIDQTGVISGTPPVPTEQEVKDGCSLDPVENGLEVPRNSWCHGAMPAPISERTVESEFP